MLGPAVAAAGAVAPAVTAAASGLPMPCLASRHVPRRARNLNDVSFDLHAGEVLGIVALEGQGQDELFDILSGQARPGAGEVLVDGSPVQLRHPADAIREDRSRPGRRASALLMQRSVRENIGLPRIAPRGDGAWSTPARRDAGSRRDRPAADRHPRAVGGKAPVGRQPAEGHDRAVAGERRADVPVLRPDPRDRHRDETRDLPARPRACGSRRRGAAADVRARGDPARLRAIVIFGGRVMDELPGGQGRRADPPSRSARPAGRAGDAA